LADLQTIEEVKGTLAGLKLAFVGDGNNMANSLMIGAAKMGMNFSIASPKQYLPQASIVEKAKQIAQDTGSIIKVTTDPVEAVKEADVIYTDVWASMGQEVEQAKRLKEFANYQVNQQLLDHAKSDYIFMHCLPAHRGEEVTADIIDGDHSVVFQEAENRLHAQKALMVALMAD
ncbi:MAG: ornithine carbamoyltransferase, partial [Amphibacillus sp.]|nr:ornithine carbamoyltransferase [Amphibacillus sp.]